MIITSHRQSRISPRSQAFTLIEVLACITVVGLLVGLTAVTVLGFRTPGGRQGAMLQLSSAIEEARMSAIESRSTIYLGLAGAAHPDTDKRMHAYILFREPTAEEIAALPSPPATGTYRAITEWQSLPKGLYWDVRPTGSVAADATAELDTHGVAGPSSKLHVIAFGPLGSVERPATAPLVLAVTPGQFDEVTGSVTSTDADTASSFILQINRLTGRVNTLEPAAPAASPPAASSP